MFSETKFNDVFYTFTSLKASHSLLDRGCQGEIEKSNANRSQRANVHGLSQLGIRKIIS